MGILPVYEEHYWKTEPQTLLSRIQRKRKSQNHRKTAPRSFDHHKVKISTHLLTESGLREVSWDGPSYFAHLLSLPTLAEDGLDSASSSLLHLLTLGPVLG